MPGMWTNIIFHHRQEFIYVSIQVQVCSLQIIEQVLLTGLAIKFEHKDAKHK